MTDTAALWVLVGLVVGWMLAPAGILLFGWLLTPYFNWQDRRRAREHQAYLETLTPKQRWYAEVRYGDPPEGFE